MKPLFYHMFHSFNKSLPIAAFLILFILPIKNYTQDGQKSYDKIRIPNDPSTETIMMGDTLNPPPLNYYQKAKIAEYKKSRFKHYVERRNGKNVLPDESRSMKDFFYGDSAAPRLDVKKLREFQKTNADGLHEFKEEELNPKDFRTLTNKTLLGNGFLLIEDIEQEWDGAWRSFRRHSYTYDPHNNLIEMLWQIGNTSAGLNNYEKHSYSYDSNNNLLEEFVKKWNGSSWVNLRQRINTYDTNNNLIEEIYKSWWNGIPEYAKYTKRLYTYVGNNLTEGIIQTTLNGSSWVNYKRWLYEYDGSNKISEIYQEWPLLGSAWVNKSKLSYTYENNKLIAEVGQLPVFQINQALDFDGSDDYVQCSGSGSIGIANYMTVEAWIKVPSSIPAATRVGIIIGKYDSSPNFNFEVHTNGRLRFYWNGGNPDVFESTIDLRDNTWHHVAATRDFNTNQIKLYIDGQLKSTQTAGSSANYQWPLRIGNDFRTSPGVPFHGVIDEIRLWNVVRTQSEIAGSRNIQLNGNEPGLLAYYDFNMGIPNGNNTNPPVNTLPDITGNSHDGILYKFALNGTNSNWVNGAFELENAWLNEHKYTYSYVNDNLNQSTIQNWNGSDWINDKMYTYSYNSSDSLVQELYQYWDGSDWLNVNRWTYTYDSNNNMTQELFQEWNNPDWLNIERYTYGYNANNNKIDELHQYWDGSLWEFAGEYLNTYDINNNMTIRLYKGWDGYYIYSRNIFSYIPIQVGSSEINGRVTDIDTLSIQNAVVSLTGDYGTSKTDTTDSSGNYDFNDLFLGNYNITVTALGYHQSNKDIRLSDTTLSGVYTVNFTLYPGTPGSIPITNTNDLILNADTITNIGYNKFVASGNVNINGILYFDCDVTVDKNSSLYFPEVRGNGKLTAKNIKGLDYEIAKDSFVFCAKENQLKPISFKYYLNGSESLLGFQTKIGMLEIEKNSTDLNITAYFIPWGLPYPLQDVIDDYIENFEETLISGLPYTEDLFSAARTYSRVNGKDWSLNILLTNRKNKINFGSFAIDEFSFYRRADSIQTIGGGISLFIPGPPKDSIKNKNLKMSLESLNNIQVDVVDVNNGKFFSSDFKSVLESTGASVSFFKGLNMEIEFVGNKINKLIIGVNTEIPLGSTGLNITQISGGVDSLTTSNWVMLANIDVKSDIKVKNIPVVSFVDFGVRIAPWSYFEGGGIFNIFKKEVASGYITYDASLKTLLLTANLDLYDILIGNLDVSLKAGEFKGSYNATLKTPSNIPSWLGWARNKTLASTQVDIHNTTMRAKVNLKIGRVCLPWAGCKNIYADLAMKLAFNGKSLPDLPFDLYLGTNYNNLIQIKKGMRGGKQQISFEVTENTPQLLVVAGNDNNLFDFELISPPPSNKIFDSTNTGYSQYDDTKQTVMIVDKPQHGEWQFLTAQTGPITLETMGINQQPTALVKQPIERGTSSNSISLKFNDYRDTLEVEVYYDTDNKNFDGVFIQKFTVINNAGQNDSLIFQWLNNDVPNGEYFIYCRIDDGQNTPILQYAPGSINVHNSDFSEIPQNFTVVQEGDSTVKASWTGSSASSVTIVYYKNISSGKIGQTALADSNYVDLRNLKFGQEYKFWACFVDPDNNTPGPKSISQNLIFNDNFHNNPPYFTLNPDSSWIFIEDEAGNFNLTAGDADGDGVSFNLFENPFGMTVVGNQLSWTPTYEDRGVFNILLTCSDGHGGIDSVYQEVIVYTQDQVETQLEFSSLNLYEQDNMFIKINNYKSTNNIEHVTLINISDSTGVPITVDCRRVDDFQFIGDFDLSYKGKSNIPVKSGDILLAIYGSDTTYAIYDSLVQQNDNTAPAQINDLQIVSSGANQIKLKWTATGDDGSIGNAFEYDLRYSYLPILNENDYFLAERYATNFYPAPCGQPDSVILNLKNLIGSASHDTVYFSVKAEDDMQNRSSLGDYAQYNYLIIPDSVIASVFNVYKVNIDWSGINEKYWRIEEKGNVVVNKYSAVTELADNSDVLTEVSKKDPGIDEKENVTIDHYKVYRKIDNNSFIVIADSVTSSIFTDNIFSSPDGIYKYGIKAVYNNGSESEMASSNSVTMNRFSNFRILCTVEDSTDYGSIHVLMEGLDTVYHQIYSRTTSQSGLILIDNVFQSSYVIEISKFGYPSIIDTISITDSTNQFLFTLKLIITSNISLLIEGLYNTSSDILNMTDTVKVYLRNVTSPYAIVDSAICTIDSLTFTGRFDFKNANNGTYYLVIKHRNSIETWSKEGGELFVKSTIDQPTYYEFLYDSSYAYGNNMKLINGYWCIYSGDVNQDGIVDSTDLTLINSSAFNYSTGYQTTDLSGDNFVDINDLVICDNNAFNNISAITPVLVPIAKPEIRTVSKEE